MPYKKMFYWFNKHKNNQHYEMQGVKPEKPFFIKWTHVRCLWHLLVRIGDNKTTQHKEKIHKKITVVNKIVIEDNSIGESAEVKENDHAGENAPEDV